MSRPILPGATIGILGGGQLGRMLAMVARRSGYCVHIMTDRHDAPAGHFANRIFCAEFSDERAFKEFIDSIDVLTFEFESVPSEPLEHVRDLVPIRPCPNVFFTTQNRLREKSFLMRNGIPIAPFASIESLPDLERAMGIVGTPAVIKTVGQGYDGKGQAIIHSAAQAGNAWQAIEQRPATLEKFVNLAAEVSIVIARSLDGEIAYYDPIRNVHRNHILDLSVSPSGRSQSEARQLTEIAVAVAQAFELVGLICIEFFLTREGEILVNEIAPRVHNSAHLTIEAHATSQFEQQLRAVCGLPLGCTRQIRPAAMVNLLGDLWLAGEPDWSRVARVPEAYLHLYEKHPPQTGRKMGHITVCAENAAIAESHAIELRRGLTGEL